MVENERYEGAIQMVTALAKLFRISLSKGKNIITVADELEHVRNYLTIQKIRYKNKFSYDITAEPETLSCQTIKLIVQPLVENAIYHGMEFMDGDGEIHIRAYRKGKDLYIDVVDNGLGMPQEQADALLTEDTGRCAGRGLGSGLKMCKSASSSYSAPTTLSLTVSRTKGRQPASICRSPKKRSLWMDCGRTARCAGKAQRSGGRAVPPGEGFSTLAGRIVEKHPGVGRAGGFS